DRAALSYRSWRPPIVGASAMPMAWLPGALGILGHSWAAPGSARDLIRSPKTAKAAERRAEYIPVPAKATRRGASPRAPARSLLVVTGHRLETPTRGVLAWPGLDIGRCNDDMGVPEDAPRGG